MKDVVANLGYTLNERKLNSLRPFFSDDYRRLIFLTPWSSVAYYGLEHRGTPKLPDITVIPNLLARQGQIFGSTMGHQHVGYLRGDTRQAQEIYEFQGDGAMLLRSKGVVTLHVLEKGEKVAVSPKDHMTIFNLGQQDLHLLDYADPERNFSNKDLEEKIGPLLVMGKKQDKFFGYINPHYSFEGLVGREGSGEVNFSWDSSKSIKGNFEEHAEEFFNEGVSVVLGGNLPKDSSIAQTPLLNLVLKKSWDLSTLLGW